MDKDLAGIREVQTTQEDAVANDRLTEGWLLMAVSTSGSFRTFVLGRPASVPATA